MVRGFYRNEIQLKICVEPRWIAHLSSLVVQPEMVKELTLSWFSTQLSHGTAIDAYCQQYALHTGKNDPLTSGDATRANEA